MPREESVLSLPIATEKAEKRVQGIDLLRGLCILAVVLHHINLRIHFRESSRCPSISDAPPSTSINWPVIHRAVSEQISAIALIAA